MSLIGPIRFGAPWALFGFLVSPYWVVALLAPTSVAAIKGPGVVIAIFAVCLFWTLLEVSRGLRALPPLVDRPVAVYWLFAAWQGYGIVSAILVFNGLVAWLPIPGDVALYVLASAGVALLGTTILVCAGRLFRP